VVQSPVEAKDISCSLCAQANSEAHPASYPMGTEGSFPGVKDSWEMMLTTHPHLVPRSFSAFYIKTKIYAVVTIVGLSYVTQ
jgi:hypothetical protein